MTRRMWLVVLAAWPAQFRKVDWFAELGPIPHELERGDHVAMVCWPSARGRLPTLAATVAVTKLSRETATLRLRHRVSAIAGHEVPIASLGARLAIARGWTPERRDEVMGCLRLISDTDFELIEDALLTVALRHGPPARRPTHSQPRTPGRRALIAGRAANPRRAPVTIYQDSWAYCVSGYGGRHEWIPIEAISHADLRSFGPTFLDHVDELAPAERLRARAR